MNLDKVREIRSPAVIEPVVVGEPGIGPRERDEFSRMRVIEPERSLLAAIEMKLEVSCRARSAVVE